MNRRMLFTMPLALAGMRGADWSSFRGPNGTGLSDAKGVPERWDAAAGQNIAWRTALPGFGHSSPVVSGGRILLTTAAAVKPSEQGKPTSQGGISAATDWVPHTFRVLSVDAKTGKVVWDYKVNEGVPKIKRHVKGSYANPTAATNGKCVAAFFGSEGLHGLSMDGQPRWAFDCGVLNVGLKGDKAAQWGFASSPVFFEDLVIIQCDTQDSSFVATVDSRSGGPGWIAGDRDEYPGWSTPALYLGGAAPLVITASARRTRAMDARTGKLVWSFADETEVRVPTPVVAGDRVVVSGGYPLGRRFYALDAKTGKLIWNNGNGGPYTPTPVVHEEHIYICADNGVMSCYTLAEGRKVYQERLPGRGSYSASPVVAEGKLYVCSEDGDVHVLRAAPKYEVLASNSFPEGIWATPAPVGSTLYVRTAAALYAVRG